MITILNIIKNIKFEHGFEMWKNKPRFDLIIAYYDGVNWIVFHFGKHWFSWCY